ncbi:SGNH/GDSL hydrolase family protein [Agrobacterium tumefaciens]|uniref:SGNH/GDSL hydrolase family protein n=1 Tax=Agrobacterium TaxID=357 RepID=UPI00115D44B7|nr:MULTISPECIES: SGNH/GDSL hydrolase family protein [Agrobacterium]MDA5244835.1 SGNH/GDSL hydrolase family protein [Agrobacterium sp. MAFF310724]MDA5246737.1 SGNH/GDSL hydrolase family protein [Agrobacterium sp. MAFF210268]TRB17844.1 SGNH/GDSL hydrolase family protein [Agrobacterium tumefaciens]
MVPHSLSNFIFSGWMVVLLLFAGPTNGTCLSDQIVVTPNSEIAFEGDSLTYGYDETEMAGAQKINGAWPRRSKIPFPEEVGKILVNLQVTNHGFPGDRSREGIKRWASLKTASLTVLMYGTNDFGNFGKLERSLTTEEFKVNLERLIKRRTLRGGQVLLVTPPPIAENAVDAGLEPYREVVRNMARQRNLPLVEASAAMSDVPHKWVDGLHLSAAANQSLARAVSKKICVRAPDHARD